MQLDNLVKSIFEIDEGADALKDLSTSCTISFLYSKALKDKTRDNICNSKLGLLRTKRDIDQQLDILV